MKNFLPILGIAMQLICLSSCSNDELGNIYGDGLPYEINDNVLNASRQEKHLVTFANVLSKAVYERKDVREFLKAEALKQFDKNYDVLYYLAKDEYIGEKTFREILISYSSEKWIDEIEKNVPLLNILVSKIAFFNVYPEDLDVDDNEIPVAVSKLKETVLYLNGKEEFIMEKGEIPAFHVFVVNENSRVVTPENDPLNLKSSGVKAVKFKSPSYNGDRLANDPVLKSVTTDFSVVGQRTIDAFKYFYKYDGSINQMAHQRDYVYYGITPQDPKGIFNADISEYLAFIEVNPNAYFIFSDQRASSLTNGDPYIQAYSTSQKKRRLTEREQLDRLWTRGAYNFRFEIYCSDKDKPRVGYVPLRPDEIWNFNIQHVRQHPKLFRRSKNTYKINPSSFTSKKVFLGETVPLGNWDISKEALKRKIRIYEEDESEEMTESYWFDFPHAPQQNFEGNCKVGVGLQTLSTESKYPVTTEFVKKTITVTRPKASDHLGDLVIYFYDPIVEHVSTVDNTCVMRTYNSGCVELGITAR
jgi:hypothetical protein